MAILLQYILSALVLTCVSEIVPLLFVKGNKKKWITSSLLCNVITNPIINILYMLMVAVIENDIIIFGILIMLEVLVVVFEAFLYHNNTDESIKKCTIVSIICNVFSFVLGQGLFYLLEYALNPYGSNEVFELNELAGFISVL